MNKNKGFTLVELVAVIGIISIILLITFPSVTNQIETTKKNKYKNFLADLCLASETYINSDEQLSSELSQNENLSFELSNLINKGYIKSNLENPKTKKKISPTDTLTVKVVDDTYECTLN
jgi:type IV pilus assembly protein PilA